MAKRALITAVCVFCVGCADKRHPFHLEDSEGADDTGSGAVSEDTGSDSAVPDSDSISTDSENDGSDTADPGGTDSGETDSATEETSSDSGSESEATPGELGDPCWKAVFGSSHPNAGLPDCADSLICVGDSDEAWCSSTCAATGAVSSEPPIEGWCCGEIGSACNPSRYYLPESMASNCVPRVLSLGDACTNGGDQRCASVCDGTTTVETVVCTQTQGGGFCSFGCTDDSECAPYSAFAAGCCGSAMGSSYCLVEASDSCLSAQ